MISLKQLVLAVKLLPDELSISGACEGAFQDEISTEKFKFEYAIRKSLFSFVFFIRSFAFAFLQLLHLHSHNNSYQQIDNSAFLT